MLNQYNQTVSKAILVVALLAIGIGPSLSHTQNVGSFTGSQLTKILNYANSHKTQLVSVLSKFGRENVIKFANYMERYRRAYSLKDLSRKLAIYLDRLSKIEESKRMYASGQASFFMHESPYTDYDFDQRKAMRGVKANLVPIELDGALQNTKYELAEGEVVDWRNGPCEVPVRQQGDCGSCYAFSTLSVVSSMMCMAGNPLKIFSAQQIVDCTLTFGNYGCDGGFPEDTFDYLRRTQFAALDSCYQYTGVDDGCRIQKLQQVPECLVQVSNKTSSIRYTILHNPKTIMKHVKEIGPVVGLMNTDPRSFDDYRGGIYDDEMCGKEIDHAIVIVGYGRENSTDYWIIKNSWGIQDWGELGYGRVKMGVCNLGSKAIGMQKL